MTKLWGGKHMSEDQRITAVTPVSTSETAAIQTPRDTFQPVDTTGIVLGILGGIISTFGGALSTLGAIIQLNADLEAEIQSQQEYQADKDKMQKEIVELEDRVKQLEKLIKELT